MTEEQQARRLNPTNESGFYDRDYDEPNMHDWSDRDIIMWLVRKLANLNVKQIRHEQICSARWGWVRWLLIGCLSGIGLIIVNLIGGYVTHLFQAAAKGGL